MKKTLKKVVVLFMALSIIMPKTELQFPVVNISVAYEYAGCCNDGNLFVFIEKVSV